MVDLNNAPQGILLDIEGTTSSISFVHEVMFPFAARHLETFLEAHFTRPDVQDAAAQIARDAGYESLETWTAAVDLPARQVIQAESERLMAQDAKATGLKALQGLIWHGGFTAGELKAHVYADVIPTIRRWRSAGCDVRIYSSGSIAAQKLFFAHLDDWGDCLELFSGHYDTTMGGKKDADSYRHIASDWSLASEQILFISDVAAELNAAVSAGCQAVASVRPGNAPLGDEFQGPKISSFEQLIWS